MDTQNLKNEMKRQRFTVGSLSKAAGMCRQTLWSRLGGKSEFTADEIAKLVKLLNIPPSKVSFFFLQELSNDNKRSSEEVGN